MKKQKTFKVVKFYPNGTSKTEKISGDSPYDAARFAAAMDPGCVCAHPKEAVSSDWTIRLLWFIFGVLVGAKMVEFIYREL